MTVWNRKRPIGTGNFFKKKAPGKPGLQIKRIWELIISS